jgi:hypothetical protein
MVLKVTLYGRIWVTPEAETGALYPRAPNALPRFSSDSFAMLFFIEQL